MFCNCVGIAWTGEGKRDERLIGTPAGALSTSGNWNWRWLQLVRRGVFTGRRSLPSSGLNLLAGDKWICQFSSALMLWILTPYKFINFNSCGSVIAFIAPNTSPVLSSRTASSQTGNAFTFTTKRKPEVSQFFFPKRITSSNWMKVHVSSDVSARHIELTTAGYSETKARPRHMAATPATLRQTSR